MFQRFRLLTLIIVAIWFAPAHLVASPTDLPVLATVKVTAVVDGDTITLATGKDVRLTGIQAPKLSLGRPNFAEWPLANEAKGYLESLSLEQSFALHIGGNVQDRHGRVLAHPVSQSGLWLQGEMVRAGFARVYTFADNRSQAAPLYALEREARAALRGIWAHPFYAIRPTTPKALEPDIATFQVVQGHVQAAEKVRSRIYLNFGDDYREDFTVSIDRSVWSLFEDSGVDPLGYAGRVIRVRGWIRDFNGPLIELTHPEQLELVGD